MAPEQMKRCSTLLAVREMKTQTTARHYFTPSRMVIKRQTITSVIEDVKKSEPFYAVGGDAKWSTHFGKQSGSSPDVYPWSSHMTQ